MSYFNNRKLKQQRHRDNVIGEAYQKTPTFNEVFDLAYEETRATELLTSNLLMRERFQNPQKERLRKLRDEGTISEEVWNVYSRNTRRGRRTDWEGLAEYANENHDGDFDFSWEGMASVIREESEQRQQVMGKADPSGMIAGFGGTAAGMFTGPVEIAALAVPGTPMRFGKAGWSTLTKMAFREGLVNTAVEGVAVGEAAAFQQRLGMEYGLGEGAANLLAAFAFGGVIGAGRAKTRMMLGDVSVRDAIEAQEVLLKELSEVGPLDPTMRVVQREIENAQAVFKMMVEEGDGNMSVRDGYNQVSRRLNDLVDTAITPASRASGVADADLEAARAKPDVEEDFTPDLDLETPIDSQQAELGSLLDAVPAEEGVEPPRTFGEAIARLDADTETTVKNFDDYWVCRNG